ncbi:hypothetical protein CBW65_05400 [Tumebacillus avium]|uniref:Uncharacterized protein n=2 Tax=Tumebacillus avium TaxID=1903704 RepID=A0A1Y0IL62_9BACL|nr:hypothetical protein CBW65_05400 [Tumebacillus avium]
MNKTLANRQGFFHNEEEWDKTGAERMADQDEMIRNLMSIIERMVDLQDRMVKQLETVTSQVEELQQRLDNLDPQDLSKQQRLN